MITAVFSHLFVILEWVNRCPLPVKRAAAETFTRFCFLVLPGVQRTMVRNLAGVMPGVSAVRRWNIARRIVINYGQYFIDYFSAYFTPGEKPAADYFSEWIGYDHVREVMAADSGVLLVTPHLGNWELGLLALREYRARLAVITAPIASANMRRKLETFRRDMGLEVVTLEDPAQYIFVLKRLLAQRKVVTLLADRYVGGVYATVPFFGRPARLPPGYLHLARAYGAPVLPCFIVRNAAGKYTCIAERPIRVAPAGDREAAIGEALQPIVELFEKYIRAYTLQWYRFTPIWVEDGG